MTQYQDAAHEAYRRLKWAEANRPDAEQVEAVRKQLAREERRRKINRFRKSVA